MTRGSHMRYDIRTSSPILRDLFTGMGKRREDEASAKAGLSHVTVWSWRTGRNSPRLVDFEAFLEACGYELALVRPCSELPPVREWLGWRA